MIFRPFHNFVPLHSLEASTQRQVVSLLVVINRARQIHLEASA